MKTNPAGYLDKTPEFIVVDTPKVSLSRCVVP